MDHASIVGHLFCKASGRLTEMYVSWAHWVPAMARECKTGAAFATRSSLVPPLIPADVLNLYAIVSDDPEGFGRVARPLSDFEFFGWRAIV